MTVNFTTNQTHLPGCFEVIPQVRRDSRGYFVKTFNQDMFRELNFEENWAEDFYSLSQQGVLRGLHFQTPPYHHAKLVHCIVGRVLDAVVDLRKGSPTYGQHHLMELSAEKANMVYIPAGIAHGFCTLSEEAVTVYKAGAVYSPKHDTGILWNSAGIPWPERDYIISERDNSFLTLEEFESPFTWKRNC